MKSRPAYAETTTSPARRPRRAEGSTGSTGLLAPPVLLGFPPQEKRCRHSKAMKQLPHFRRIGGHKSGSARTGRAPEAERLEPLLLSAFPKSVTVLQGSFSSTMGAASRKEADFAWLDGRDVRTTTCPRRRHLDAARWRGRKPAKPSGWQGLQSETRRGAPADGRVQPRVRKWRRGKC